MNVDPTAPGNALEKHLARSDELRAEIMARLGDADLEESGRAGACYGMASLSLEHAFAVRLLMGSACPTSAVALVRLQFEAVVRAMWILYAAPDVAVEKLIAPLTQESELAAKALPSISKMIKAIGRRVGTRAPAAAHEMLAHFQDVSIGALNSFVHGGIHPLRRHLEGVPMPIAIRIVENSNGLSTMAGMTMAVLTADSEVIKSIGRIQKDFFDCLPVLLPGPPGLASGIPMPA